MASGRRKFIREAAAAAAGLAGLSAMPSGHLSAQALHPTKYEIAGKGGSVYQGKPRIRFSVIGLNHGHINSQVKEVKDGGGELVSFYAKEQDLAAAFSKNFPEAKQVASTKQIMEDKSIQLIVSAAIPDERAIIGIEAMNHGKDFMSDKPGAISLEQLEQVKQVQKKTGRIYSILYGERFENRATTKAAELARSGAIGKVIQTIGLGPHRMNMKTRPQWFFDKKRFGGILTDIASHQFDQFLYFTNSKQAEVIASQTGNVNHPEYPGLEDFGDAMLQGDGGAGYLRVDWFTPDGLKTWGDTRLTVLGTEGYIEVRKNIDIASREGDNHLFLVDHKETRYIDCRDVALLYGTKLVDDIINRTETAMTQEHCFLATELSLRAQRQAKKLELNHSHKS